MPGNSTPASKIHILCLRIDEELDGLRGAQGWVRMDSVDEQMFPSVAIRVFRRLVESVLEDWNRQPILLAPVRLGRRSLGDFPGRVEGVD